MGLSYQSKFAKALKTYQEKAQKFQIKMTGTEVKTVLISYLEDKYGDTQQTVLSNVDITAVFDFPNDEVPVSLSSTQDTNAQTSNNTLHLYDIIPITCYIANEDIRNYKVTKGSIIFYPIKMMDGNVSLTFFQVVDSVMKGNPNYSILWSAFTVAPITDFAFRNSPQFKTIVNNYIASLANF